MTVPDQLDLSLKLTKEERLVDHLDPRHARVVSFSAATPDEKRHQYLYAPWHPVEAESRRHARVKLVETVVASIEATL